MKMDKQALAKHHFWILLGVFTVLALVLLLVIPLGVGATIEEKANAHKKMVDDLNANKNVKSKGLLEKLGGQKDVLSVKREELHKDMYRRQRDLLAFPGDLNDKYKDKEFGSPIDQSDRLA